MKLIFIPTAWSVLLSCLRSRKCLPIELIAETERLKGKNEILERFSKNGKVVPTRQGIVQLRHHGVTSSKNRLWRKLFWLWVSKFMTLNPSRVSVRLLGRGHYMISDICPTIAKMVASKESRTIQLLSRICCNEVLVFFGFGTLCNRWLYKEIARASPCLPRFAKQFDCGYKCQCSGFYARSHEQLCLHYSGRVT